MRATDCSVTFSEIEFMYLFWWVATVGKFLVVLDLNFLERHVAGCLVRQSFVDGSRYGNDVASATPGSFYIHFSCAYRAPICSLGIT